MGKRMGKGKERISIINFDSKFLKYCFVVLGIITCLASTANARVYTFTTLDFPGAVVNTYLEGINNFGTIVGTYNDATGSHGFLFAGESFTRIDFPDVAYTWGYGINNLSDIVGGYVDGAGGYTMAFSTQKED
jgi:hypothetical protein